jgi:hypothetical protein
MAVNGTDLHKLYLAYFGRCPDLGGLAFYQGDPAWTSEAVAAGFSASAESQALYGSEFGEAQVQAIYRNLFDREAEPEGVAYWTEAVHSGRLNAAGAALAILQGARGEDRHCVAHKLYIAEMLGTVMHLLPATDGFYGDDMVAMARNVLAHVDRDPQSMLLMQHYLGARFEHLQPGVIELPPPPPVPEGDFWHF